MTKRERDRHRRIADAIQAQAPWLFKTLKQGSELGRRIRARLLPRTTKQAYVDEVLRKIHRREPHRSLGSNISEESKRKALNTFHHLRRQSVARQDVVVDYGCGTLRVGRHWIEYLDPDRYIGFDLDKRIFQVGLALLDPEELHRKRPRCLEITPDNLQAVRELEPRLIFAKGVLQHVAPDDLDEFFANLACLSAKASILVAMKPGVSSRRLSDRSWIHGLEDVIQASGRAGLELINAQGIWHHFRRKT